MKTMKTRIAELISKLDQTNYEIYDGDKKDCLEELEKAFTDMLAYANHVIMQQYQFRLWSVQFDGEEFRDRVSTSDTRRRNYHLGACASVNMLNRLCKAVEVEELFPGIVAGEDREGRRQAAIAIGSFIVDLYYEGIGVENPDRVFDFVTYGKDGKTYEPDVVHRFLRDIAG